jgi:hypothetical protein
MYVYVNNIFRWNVHVIWFKSSFIQKSVASNEIVDKSLQRAKTAFLLLNIIMQSVLTIINNLFCRLWKSGNNGNSYLKYVYLYNIQLLSGITSSLFQGSEIT